MKKTTFRRLCAYVIDLVVISLISTLFLKIEFINPNYDKYEKVYEDYLNYVSDITDINQIQNDTKITDYSYDLAKYGIASSIITLVVTALYFGGFQYLNKGQTLGKNVCKIKVVNNENKAPKFYQILLRSVLINSLLVTLINILAVAFASKTMYFKIIQYTQLLDTTIICVSFILMMFREDGKGLHDLLAGTKVVFVNSEEVPEIKEAKIVEEPKKKKTTKKKTTKANKENK